MTFPEPHAKEVDPPVITPKRNIVKKHDKYQETKILNFFEEFEQYLMFFSLKVVLLICVDILTLRLMILPTNLQNN